MISSSHQAAVVQLYLSVLNRLPDPQDLEQWTGRLAEGTPLVSVIETFLDQADTDAIYPAVNDSAAFVTAYYQTVLCREPDAAGLVFWAEVLTQSGGSASSAARARFIAEIGEVVATPLSERPPELSEQAYVLTVADRTLITSKLAVGLRYVANGEGADATAATAALAQLGCGCTSKAGATPAIDAPTPAVPPGTPPPPSRPIAAPMHFVLTTGVDNAVGDTGNDTIEGTHLTLNLTDTLDGGAGIDTLTYVSTAGTAFSMPAAHISNIEIIRVSNQNTLLDARAAVTVDAENFIGATDFDAYLSTGDVNVLGLDAGQGLGITGDGALVNSKVSAAYLDGVTTAALRLTDGVTSGMLDVAGVDLAAVTLQSTGAANVLRGLNLADSVTQLKISAENDLSLGRMWGVGLQKISVEGAATLVNLGSLDAAGLSVIDASGLSNGGIHVSITAGGTTPVTINGGQRNDDIVTGSAGGTVTGGGGKDAIHVGNGAVVGKGAGGEVLERDLFASLLTITDFDLGDVIGFVGTSNPSRLTGTPLTTLNLNNENFLINAVNTAAFITNEAGTSSKVEAFIFGSDTYLLANLGASNPRSFGTGDILVKLTGLIETDHLRVTANNEVFYGGVWI